MKNKVSTKERVTRGTMEVPGMQGAVVFPKSGDGRDPRTYGELARRAAVPRCALD